MCFLLLLYKWNKKHKENFQEQTENWTKRNIQAAIELYKVFWRIGLIYFYRIHTFFFKFDWTQQGELLLKIT